MDECKVIMRKADNNIFKLDKTNTVYASFLNMKKRQRKEVSTVNSIKGKAHCLSLGLP